MTRSSITALIACSLFAAGGTGALFAASASSSRTAKPPADNLSFRFAHVGISVPDLEKAKAWYHRVLGFDLERETALPFVPAKIAIMKRGNLRIELFEAEDYISLPPDRRHPNRDIITNGTKHVAFEVDDMKAAVANLRARGADIAFQYGNRALFIRDNSGNLIEFIQSTAPAP